jgi:hypothetical protein
MKNFLKILQSEKLDLLLYIILTLAYLVRAIDLNYNTAFNDEAIYIVIGRMGLFASDWWSYGANRWMAGLPYIYPTLSALAYQTGGLLASRYLNVIFGVLIVEETYRLSKLLAIFDKKTNNLAALIAAFLVAFSSIGIYVSKLATYDLLSFLALIFGINSFMKARYYTNGKYYFLCFVGLFFAFLTKIVAVFFFPLLLVLSTISLRKRSERDRKMALYYLYIPFVIAGILFAILHLDDLITFITTHQSEGVTTVYTDILGLIWYIAGVVISLSALVSPVILRTQKLKKFAVLFLLALIIPASHLFLRRYATLDKHLFLTIIFLSVFAGYGISRSVLKVVKSKSALLKTATFSLGLLLFLLYPVFSYSKLLALEKTWKNTTKIQNYLKQNVHPGDKILTENGAAVILALYDTVFPPGNIVTFDWIDYAGLQGNAGYFQALDDKYFDYIEMDNEFGSNDELKAGIRKRLEIGYKLVFDQDGFNIYEKNRY